MGSPPLYRVGRVGHGRHPSCACKGQTKGLRLTERRLSFDYVECKAFGFAETTPRPEDQVLRLTVGGD